MGGGSPWVPPLHGTAGMSRNLPPTGTQRVAGGEYLFNPLKIRGLWFGVRGAPPVPPPEEIARIFYRIRFFWLRVGPRSRICGEKRVPAPVRVLGVWVMRCGEFGLGEDGFNH